jgi:hypothetical protein
VPPAYPDSARDREPPVYLHQLAVWRWSQEVVVAADHIPSGATRDSGPISGWRDQVVAGARVDEISTYPVDDEVRAWSTEGLIGPATTVEHVVADAAEEGGPPARSRSENVIPRAAD